MDIGSIAVTVLRLVVPFSILRYPIGGIIACMILDTYDNPLADILGGRHGFGGEVIGYHRLDKVLDIYYLAFAFVVSLRWENPLTRRTSIILFSHRLVGVALFLLTGWRSFLLIFPNIFEYFFLAYLIIERFFPRFRLETISRLVIVLLIVGLPQVFREYVYHYLDMGLYDYFDIVSRWDWIKTRFLQIPR